MTERRLEHFDLRELVDPDTFARYGDDCWNLFTPEILDALAGVRKWFGAPVTVNNWHLGGPHRFRGYRPPECGVGALLSRHKQGNAFDCDVKGFTAPQARNLILNNLDDPLLKEITRIEGYVSWLHFDCGPLPKGKKRIWLFKA